MMSDPQFRGGSGLQRHRLIGLVAGPVLGAAILLAPPPTDLSPDGWAVAAVAILMAVWWTTEALPLAATALLPLALLPLLGVQTIGATAPAYAHPLIFLFFGGFLMARALQVWSVDKRLALAVLRRTGARQPIVIAAVMGVTAFLSMWVSNTATAMMMLPIGLSIIAATARPKNEAGDGGDAAFAAALMLGIAYAATIGGMGTLIGTPPNALFAAYMESAHGVNIGFARWLLIGVPLILILLPLAWLVLTRLAFHVADAARAPDAGGDRLADRLDEERAALGPLSRGGWMASVVAALAALGWLIRPALEQKFPGLALSDAGIAIIGALALFVLPVDLKRGRFVLAWQEAVEIRWDVLILFGGGLALATAIGESDLAPWLGDWFASLSALPLIVLMLVIGAVTVYVGELASNTAMAAVLLPIAGAAAVAMGEPAASLALPVALFATLGFMLPVATPPNAIVFGSGVLSVGQMVRAGAAIDIAGIVVVTAAVLTIGAGLF